MISNGHIADAVTRRAGRDAPTASVTTATAQRSRRTAFSKGTLGPDHPLVATLLNNVVMVSGKPGRDADAEALFKRSRTIR
jgi:hypothetical protein